MGRILRVGLMMLLVAAASVGIARGGVIKVGNIEWQYVQIGTTNTCRIKPKDTATISGKVDIPNTVNNSLTVVEIEPLAFENCSRLTAVDIPNSVTKIGIGAFSGCKRLTAVKIPNGVKQIEGSVFSKCSSLTEITIPSSVATIDAVAFLGCSGLKNFKVDESNASYCAVAGVLFTKTKDKLICCPKGMEGEYVIPDGVTMIGGHAFADCKKLSAVTIPSSVKTIGNSAFYGCKWLKEFKVEQGNERYDVADGVLFTKDMQTLIAYPGGRKGAFKIPYGVTEIGDGAFSGCDGLTEVTIPGSVTEIGDGVFHSCGGLTEVTIPSSVTAIKWGTFYKCSKLTEVTIPSSVTEIGGKAFYGCSGLTKVTIPGSVTAIKWGAFYECSKLTEVTIPSSVTFIGEEAFAGSGLTAVYWLADANCRVNKDAFKGIASPATLYVRPGKKTEFVSKSSWWIGIFTIKEGYLVTFTDSDGTKLGEQLVKPNNGTATEPTAPTREGYTFVEWQRNNAKYDFINTKVTEDITLVAVWKENTYTVTFDAKGGTPAPGAQKVVKDGTATAPTAPTREGYIFDGWQLDGAKYDFGAKVTKDITLVAVWKEVVKYKVTFDAKGGAPTPNVQEVEEGKAATAPTAPTKEGYTFVEWQLDGVKYVFSTPVTKDITLVAVWKKKEESTPSTPKDPETAVESVQLAGVRVVKNPMGDVLELEGMERAVRVEVYSVVGVRVHAEALRGEPRVVIDAQGWAHGVYVVKVEASDGARTLRVVR